MIHFKEITIYMSSSLFLRDPDIEPLFLPQPKRMWFLVKEDDISLNNIELSEEEIKGTIFALETIVQKYRKDDLNILNLETDINELKSKLLSRYLHIRLQIKESLTNFLLDALKKWNPSQIIDAFELVVIRANQYWIKTTERSWTIQDRVTEITEPA